MADKEFSVDHREISNPQTITKRNVELFKENGCDIHVHEVKEIHDDHKKGVRTYKVKGPKKYFFMGGK